MGILLFVRIPKIILERNFARRIAAVMEFASRLSFAAMILLTVWNFATMEF